MKDPYILRHPESGSRYWGDSGALLPITPRFVLIVEAPAKINLGLHVLRRRQDGYHDIDTVMLRLAWFDNLEALPGDGLTLACDDPAIPLGPGNLCLRAAKALASHHGLQRGARLHLTKRIPVGAGLGGGSSDAAAALRLLSRLWGLPTTDEELSGIGAGLGADVPFFLGPSPARARGKGERLAVVTSDDGSPLQLPFSFAVIKPETSISTADAYRWVSPSDRHRVDLSGLIRSRDLDRWRADLTNDFEEPIAARFPVIAQIRSLLLEAGAGYASLTGSGSAVFGVFERETDAETARDAGRDAGFICWAGTPEN